MQHTTNINAIESTVPQIPLPVLLRCYVPVMNALSGAADEAPWASRVMDELVGAEDPCVTICDARKLYMTCQTMRFERPRDRALSRDLRRVMRCLRASMEQHGVTFEQEDGVWYAQTDSEAREEERIANELRIREEREAYAKTPSMRGIEVRFYGPTDYRGSRIGLIDHEWKERVTLSRDYSHENIMAQAAAWLRSRGFTIAGSMAQVGNAPSYLLTTSYGARISEAQG
jgi:hypothetical protein